MAYLDWLDLDELQRQKQVESQAYSDAIAVQNHSASNNETPKEPPELAAQTQAMTKDSDNPYNPTVAESPESPVPIRELIATSPHVLSDGENAASSQGAPAPQRSLSDDFVAAVDDASSDGEPDPSPDGDDTFAEDPNIVCLGDTGDYAALDSDGGIEGSSVYDDDDEVDWVEPDPSSDDETNSPTDLIFDPALINAAGGMDAVARGAVPTCVLDDMRVDGWTVPQLRTPIPYMDEPYEDRPSGWIREDYPGIYNGEQGPTAGALHAASTALGAFLRFVIPQLLEKIAGASNDYFDENLDARVQVQHAKQLARQQKQPNFQVQTPQQIKTTLQKTLEISGQDLCIFIGLLIARTIAPNKEKFAHHWKTTDEGAIPRGCFGQFMTRDRFDHFRAIFTSAATRTLKLLPTASGNFVRSLTLSKTRSKGTSFPQP
ncbi:uncharacterized protein IUM83_04879 [Phytophthora cinnamomi]|uniref:uncharacterized protein n=1 Tax=Phytophthora cinnamomi TaxID=4785 RepID=UPI00355A97A3|nr:hypothetical protein IUM83_04879 [Phytophthora cinnamomi]